jgi:molecular chaperone GrpE
MPKTTKKVGDEAAKQIEELQAALTAAQEAEKRAVADYKNLVRRNQEERAALVKLATKGLVEDLLQPLGHLSLAARQLDDAGLNMVIGQFWQRLQDHGLEEINPEGKPFDITTMEAVESNGHSDDEENLIVVQVRQKGYKLNGQVIQFAKVVVDTK